MEQQQRGIPADAGAGNHDRHQRVLRQLDGRGVVDNICQRVTAGVSAQLRLELSDFRARQDAAETDFNNLRAALPETIRTIVRDELAKQQQPAPRPATSPAAQPQRNAAPAGRAAPTGKKARLIRIRNSRVPATIEAIANASAIKPTPALRLPSRRKLLKNLQSRMKVKRCRNPTFIALSKNLVAHSIVAIKIGGRSELFQDGHLARLTFTSEVAPHSKSEGCALRYRSPTGELCVIDRQRLSACHITDLNTADLHRVDQIVAQFCVD